MQQKKTDVTHFAWSHICATYELESFIAPLIYEVYLMAQHECRGIATTCSIFIAAKQM